MAKLIIINIEPLVKYITRAGLIIKIPAKFTIVRLFKLYSKSNLLIKQDFIIYLYLVTSLIIKGGLLNYITNVNTIIF